jgi:hypothetical protein
MRPAPSLPGNNCSKRILNHEKKAIVERMIAEARQPENLNSLGGANP